MFLRDFAADFGIGELVRLKREVVFAGLGEGGKWSVRSRPSNSNGTRCESCDGDGDGDCVDEIYDAVVVCNGHYVQPRIADNIPGWLFTFPFSILICPTQSFGKLIIFISHTNKQQLRCVSDSDILFFVFFNSSFMFFIFGGIFLFFHLKEEFKIILDY